MSELDEQESEFSRLVRQAPFDDAPRGEHGDALRERALAAFDSASVSGHTGRTWKRAIQQGRRIMRRPIPQVIAASAACLIIAAVWILAPGGQSTAQAFNMFAEALLDARSASFQMEVAIEGQPKQTAKSYHLAPAKYRYEVQNAVSIADFDGRKFVTLMPDEKRAVVMNLKNIPEEGGKRKTMDAFGLLRELLSDSHDAKDDDYEPLGEKEIDGHRAVGFRRVTPLGAITMWGDPETGMPLLVETVWNGFPRTKATMSDFQLNVDLKPELFDTTVPDDYTLQSFDVDASKLTEADLVKALRTISDMNDGEYLDGLDTASMRKMMEVMLKRLIGDEKEKENKKDEKKDIMPEWMDLSVTIGRGISFALELPESADAHYAGKGVKRGEPDRPIFWYKPEGAKQYRVIYADLSVKDEDRAPDVPGAVRLEKASPTAEPAEKK